MIGLLPGAGTAPDLGPALIIPGSKALDDQYEWNSTMIFIHNPASAWVSRIICDKQAGESIPSRGIDSNVLEETPVDDLSPPFLYNTPAETQTAAQLAR